LRYTVRARGRVSPGNQTYIMLNWMDAGGRYVGTAVADRLPDGDWPEGKTLAVESMAPPGAAYVGIGLLVYNQVGKDYVTFADVDLRVVGD